MSSLPIVIIGAGVSGLTLAQYLRKSNVPFQIFERDASISARNGGWGLTLHWGLAALRQLLPEDILSRLNETCVNKEAVSNGDTGRYQFLDLCSGSALCDVPAAERIRVSRTRLRRLLADGVDVQWSKTVKNVEFENDSVTAHFEDGTACKGSLLVACDGSHSRVRKLLYPSSYRNNPLPVQLLGTTAHYSKEQAAGARAIDPFFFQGTHSKSNVYLYFSFLDTPFNFQDSTDGYSCQIIISWSHDKNIAIPTDNVDRVVLMKRLTDDWAEPFRSLVHNLPEDSEVLSINIEDWIFRPRTEDTKRSVLMGDSAHTMTMFRGEGANNAVVDVLDFVKRVDVSSLSTFSPEEVHSSIKKYEEDVFIRAETSVLNSRRACLDAHDYPTIREGSPLVSRRVANK